jgi:hypothetical protein
VGVNEDRIAANDLNAVLDIVEPWLGTSADLAVVGANNALFHPKTYYCEHPDGTRQALIGSSNLTMSGLGENVEANIIISSDDGGSGPVLDAVRDAIGAWWSPERSANVRRIDRSVINDLVAKRVIEPSEYSPPPPRNRERQSDRREFPPFSPVFPHEPQRRPPRRTSAITRLAGAEQFPPDTVGIVKILSPSSDVKGFAGEPGTPYIALPAATAPFLPMTPYGSNDEPRLDLTIEARLDGALDEPVVSGSDTTNITWVGMGETRKSHTDLRLNILNTITHGVIYRHSVTGAQLPVGGDALAIEFLDGGRYVRLTFATGGPLKERLLLLCTEGRPPNSGWGWLPANVVPEWTV